MEPAPSPLGGFNLISNAATFPENVSWEAAQWDSMITSSTAEKFGFFSPCDLEVKRNTVESHKKRRKAPKGRKPKKPRTGYNYFHLQERPSLIRELQETHPDKESLNAEVNRRIAQRWKTLSTDVKQVHVQQSEQDKLRYEKELKDYQDIQRITSSQSSTVNLSSRCLPGTLDDLKALAEKLGVKKPGIGWPICCPPNGSKADIREAISKHREAKQRSLTPSVTGRLSPLPRLAVHQSFLSLPKSKQHHNSKSTIPQPTLPVIQPKVKTSKVPKELKMTMRNMASKTWLLDLAKKHNLLSETTEPFLKDAMRAIEKEMTLTMTRMSRGILSLVAKSQRPERTAIHRLITECTKRQETFQINKDLVQMVNDVSMMDITRPQKLVTLVTGAVQGFYILNKPLCDLLISEAKRCSAHCGLKLGQISIENLGLEDAMTRLAIESILPALGLDTSVEYEVEGSVIYDGDKPLSEEFKLTCDPADDWKFAGSERSLPNHKDI
eukprot:38043-Amorphochlora_amoeboformis.AAC.1